MRHSLPTPLYTTQWGRAYVADSLELLPLLPPESIDLVVTSPPFALQRKKEYGNETEDAHVEWLLRFAEPIGRVLKPTGSFVLDLGGAYQSGRPVRSLYNFRVMMRLCDEHGFHLAEEFFWHNPAKLPSPIEWVNKRKIRAKKRPSGHDISGNFASDNGGAIPSNLLQIPNTESNSSYLRHCATVGAKPHPARFPERLPSFFIEFLTDPGDTVLDIFAGSNTTGSAAEKLSRQWIAVDKDLAYVAASAFRFVDELLPGELVTLWNRLHSDAWPVAVHRRQGEMMLAEAPSRNAVKWRR